MAVLPASPGALDAPQTVADDVTALRAALAQCQQHNAALAAAQEAFVRAVSHDLRAPLRHVTAYGELVRELLTELLADTAAQPDKAGAQKQTVQEALDFLATMAQSAQRMGRMLDGLLALSRAQRTPLACAPVDVAALLAEVRTLLASEAAGRTVEWHIAPDLPVLWADAALLRELLGNALKFTRGRAVARIAVRSVDEEGGDGVLLVEDNGVGFDAAHAGALFGVFQRLHREEAFPGVGTGLALCRAIAERHGARIAITAVPDAGCTVRLSWPRASTGASPGRCWLQAHRSHTAGANAVTGALATLLRPVF